MADGNHDSAHNANSNVVDLTLGSGITNSLMTAMKTTVDLEESV